MSDDTKAGFAATLARNEARKQLVEYGATEQEAEEFVAGDSFVLRKTISIILLALSWVKRGGIDSLPEEKATNEFMDIDYALFGSYCDEVLTRDAGVARHHSLLSAAVAKISS